MGQNRCVGVVCEDPDQKIELEGQLRLLGEQVAQADAAQALFVVDGANVPARMASGGCPIIQCVSSNESERSQASAVGSNTTLAQLNLPAERADLELVLSRLYQHFGGGRDTHDNLLPEIIGTSPAMVLLKRQALQVAKGESTVLLTGPSGTGKSYLAETIHRHSSRAAGPFVPINCGAIPADLIESELFGHEKGAFTGAVEQRAGRFELAAGGTLFLDEIGDMPFAMQVKLLRAIQERVFERVGGVTTQTANVRIIAATNVDLEQRIADGRFREDLYYRINVFPLDVPALRERSADMPALVGHFQAQLHNQYGCAVRLSEAAVSRLQGYGWPGNLRELRNLIERLTVEHGDSLLSAESLPPKYLQETIAVAQEVQVEREDNALLPINGIDLKAHLAELEQCLIEQALRDTDAVVARAADRLHIRRTTLVEKMRKYGIDRTAH